MIYMLWRECMPIEYYKFICEEKNFLYLNGKNVLQPKVLQIIADFNKKDEKNYRLLQNNLARYKNIFQYVYSNVYPEIYCLTGKRGFDLKSNFQDVQGQDADALMEKTPIIMEVFEEKRILTSKSQ